VVAFWQLSGALIGDEYARRCCSQGDADALRDRRSRIIGYSDIASAEGRFVGTHVRAPELTEARRVRRFRDWRLVLMEQRTRVRCEHLLGASTHRCRWQCLDVVFQSVIETCGKTFVNAVWLISESPLGALPEPWRFPAAIEYCRHR